MGGLTYATTLPMYHLSLQGGAGAGDSAADALTSRLRQRWEQQRLLVAASVVTTKTSLELIHAAAAGGEVRDGAARASSPEMKGAMRTTLVGAAVLTAVRFESLTLPLEQLHQSLKIAALAPSIARRKQASQAIASAQGNLRALAVLDESRDAFALGGLGVDAAAAVAASAAAYAVLGDGTAAARVRELSAVETSVVKRPSTYSRKANGAGTTYVTDSDVRAPLPTTPRACIGVLKGHTN
ncbi:hypothetical protein T492DRAFT_429081 [Pavlovales sp. CCMP2436]|nr:hypothetical protein T492DRAFT_429081 [Pavlovales sp. CCMP2436]